MIGTPLDIRNKLKLINRIVMAPVYFGSAIYTEAFFDFMQKRIAGGAGLIILPIPTSEGIEVLNSQKFKSLSGRLLEISQGCGSKIIPQIFSGVGEKVNQYSTEEIRRTADEMALSAAYVREAGYDGFAIHGAHHSLYMHLISPLLNFREDEYGQDKTKIQLEAIRAVRKKIGDDFPFLIRFSASDLAVGGAGLEVTVPYAQALEKAGIDCLDISVGGTGASPRYSECPDHTQKEGCFIPYFESIKKAVTIPVIGCGKLHSRKIMNDVLSTGKADLLGVGRPFISDPTFPQKILNQRDSEIIPLKEWYKKLPQFQD